MNNKQLQWLSFIIGAFSVVSAFFSVFSLSPTLIYLTFGVSIALAIVAFFFFQKAKGHELAAKSLLKALETSASASKYEARTVRNELELKEASKIDEEAFPGEAFSFYLTKNLWMIYPHGMTALFECETGDMVGICAIWPLKKKYFFDIVDGRCGENDISPQSADKKGKKYWYAGAIILRKKYRRTDAIKVLLHKALTVWYEDIKDEQVVSLCAGAYSKDGELLLKRLGFAHIESEVNKVPLYGAVNLSPDEIGKIISRITGVSIETEEMHTPKIPVVSLLTL